MFKLPNQSEELQLRKKLEACKNVKQMLDVLQNDYELENCVPGIFIKPQLIDGLVKAYKFVNPKKK
jgi:hypothetical protein